MEESFSWSNFLSVLYSVSHFIRLAFYWPQIKRLKESETGEGIAVSTWSIWSFHNILTVAYAGVVSKDPLLAWLFVFNSACTSWIALTAYYKQYYKQRDIA